MYQLVALPLGLLTSGIVYVLLSGAVALLMMPLLALLMPSEGTVLFGVPFTDTAGGRAMLAGLGLVLLLFAPDRGARAAPCATSRSRAPCSARCPARSPAGWTSWSAAAPGSSTPGRPSAAGSSATCTTARSSSSSRSG